MDTKERPEALAQFAESARHGERDGVAGLTATDATKPIPTSSKAKDDAATRVLAEGATGEDFGSEEAIDKLPDRILESRGGHAADPDEAREDDSEDMDLEEAELDEEEGPGDELAEIQEPGRMASPHDEEDGGR